ncbi:hypothetical protein [Streptosporangium roseum]|uniref:hypothetical protein n=1 Tax=Streptosporangium roseum TaxID=2001 RepID=UPI0004CCC2E0|nr:hypothetical protein [Streptosporangium roseum]
MSGALVTLASGPAGANTAELVVDYRCTGGPGTIVQSGPVKLRTKVTVPTTLSVGEPLNIGWALDYKDASRFGSPDYFAPGGKVTATGNIELSGAWVGVLKPVGSAEQSGQLEPGTILELPTNISDSAHTEEAGTVKVTPRKLFLDFTPPAGEVMVNDDDQRVKYETGYWEDLNDQPANNNDHHHDIHRTVEKNARVSLSFTGTGIEYVAQRDFRAGKAQFYIDGKPATPAYIDASKMSDGTPSNDANRGGLTLWKFHGLNYGKHVVQVVNDEHGKWTQLDAFRVITKELAEPPTEHRATCTLVSAPVSVNVTISGGGGTQSPDPSGTPTVPPTCVPTSTPTSTPTGTPSATPTCNPTSTPTNTPPTTPPPTTPTPTCIITPTSTPTSTPGPSPTCRSTTTPTPTPTSTPSNTRQGNTSTSTPKPTLTVTATVTPTRATPTTPQVTVVPSGGAQTGEASEDGPSGMGLIGGGTAMVIGSVLGGVALKRRQAAHVRGRG